MVYLDGISKWNKYNYMDIKKLQYYIHNTI